MKKSIVLLLSFLMSSNSWAVIGFDSSCPLLYDCCKGLKVNDGVVSCDEVCASDEACTPVGCCKRNERVCTNKCCKVCGNEPGECCLEEKICNNDCCEEGEECVGGSCCASENKCGEGESQTCCSDGETCVGGSCCDDDKVCGEGESQTCCGSDEECVGGVCCPSEKKCGEACCDGPCNADNTGCCEKPCEETCCSADQECIEGECKCPTDKPTKCGESCCLMCNSTNTGCKCLAWETECGSTCCGANETCFNGVCVCTDGREACDGVCCSEGTECHNGTTCCDIIDKSKCPNGETEPASDGCEICKCNSPTSCPEGQELVTNYVNGIGACGEVCCGVEADGGHPGELEFYDYINVGAVNGSCCGASTYVREYDYYYGYYEERFFFPMIRNNNGYYCSRHEYGDGEYVSDSKWCVEIWENEYDCFCSSNGDPRYYGSYCN